MRNRFQLENLGLRDLSTKQGKVVTPVREDVVKFDSIANIGRNSPERWQSFNLVIARRLGELGLPQVKSGNIGQAYNKSCGCRDFFVPGDLTANMLFRALERFSVIDAGWGDCLTTFEVVDVPTMEGVVKIDLNKFGHIPKMLNLPFGSDYSEHHDVAKRWFGRVPTLEEFLYAVLLEFVVNGVMSFTDCDVRCSNPCRNFPGLTACARIHNGTISILGVSTAHRAMSLITRPWVFRKSQGK